MSGLNPALYESQALSHRLQSDQSEISFAPLEPELSTMQKHQQGLRAEGAGSGGLWHPLGETGGSAEARTRGRQGLG